MKRWLVISVLALSIVWGAPLRSHAQGQIVKEIGERPDMIRLISDLKPGECGYALSNCVHGDTIDTSYSVDRTPGMIPMPLVLVCCQGHGKYLIDWNIYWREVKRMGMKR